MDHPISIFNIYQPTRLRRNREDEEVSVADLVQRDHSAVIFAGPGRGKTIFLRHLFATLIRSASHAPLLFTLRWPGAPNELIDFVAHLTRGKAPRDRRKLLLLVDGLDEIGIDERIAVQHALKEYSSGAHGRFILTCRSFYTVGDVVAPRYEIAPFDEKDALGFISAFAHAYGASFNVEKLISDLKVRRFADFLNHPLMLALICILKAGPERDLPDTPLLLVKAAVTTLTDRWDRSRNIRRHSEVKVPGRVHFDCLKYIAFCMGGLSEASLRVDQFVRQFLQRSRFSSVNGATLLDEMAQWYGLLIPVGEATWTFTHRTIQDYLAAHQWLDWGTFVPSAVGRWDSRAAYAACLSEDATVSLVHSLHPPDTLETLTECLRNRVRFDVFRVADAVRAHIFRPPANYTLRRRNGHLAATTRFDFFALASDEFLSALLSVALRGSHDGDVVLAAYVLVEFRRRNRHLSVIERQHVAEKYGEGAIFEVSRDGAVSTVSL